MKLYDEARILILRAAEVNNQDLPNHLVVVPEESIESRQYEAGSGSRTSEARIVQAHVKTAKNSSENIIDILRSCLLCKRLLILFFGWMTVTMCYYGLSFAVDSLVGDFYVNYQFMVLIEIPGFFLAVYLLDKIGRRMTVSGSMLLGGIACLAAGLTPENPGIYRVIFSLIGKMFIACCFGGIYSYTTELFPTTSRSAAIGLCSTSGRIGGIMAPIIADLGRNVDPTIPFIVFAIICIMVAILGFTLPETNNLPLPSTVHEAEEQSEYCTMCRSCRKEG